MHTLRHQTETVQVQPTPAITNRTTITVHHHLQHQVKHEDVLLLLLQHHQQDPVIHIPVPVPVPVPSLLHTLPTVTVTVTTLLTVIHLDLHLGEAVTGRHWLHEYSLTAKDQTTAAHHRAITETNVLEINYSYYYYIIMKKIQPSGPSAVHPDQSRSSGTRI